MSIYTETRGTGPDVVLIHGWGMHGAIWDMVSERLACDYRVTLVDLPGHGRSPTVPATYTLEALALEVAQAAPQPSVWIGWSLGGAVAMRQTIDQPRDVNKLVLICSTPQFVRDSAWPHGMTAAVLQGFARELEDDYRGTILHFLALQTYGSEHAQTDLRRLQQRIFSYGPPQLEALRGGLHLLHNTRLQNEVKTIHCPVLLIMGQHDMIVPSAAGRALADRIPDAELAIIAGAGHVPFVSHPDQFMQHLTAFLHAP